MSRAAVPGYWMNESSGVLKPVVTRYLQGEHLDPHDIGVMRVYLRQWLAADFHGVDQLREQIDKITDRYSLESWFERALNIGIDPL